MRFVVTPKKVRLTEVDPFFADLLRAMSGDQRGWSDRAEARLYPSPTRDPDETELRSDWKALVEPELQKLFQEAREVVAEDLKGMRQREGHFELEFPHGHADAWVSALNQARLALVEDHRFTEQDMARDLDAIVDERTLALFKVNFYGFLLHCLVEALASEE